jgi:hypothetical protein
MNERQQSVEVPADPIPVSVKSKVTLVDNKGEPVYVSSFDEPDEYASNRTTQMALIWPGVFREAADADIDNSRICLNYKPLHDIDFRGIDLSNMNLEGCSFRGSNLTRVTLIDADLEECNFAGALMQYADVSGANLKAAAFDDVIASSITGLIMINDLNGYFCYAYQSKDDGVHVRAGCRDFNLETARRHWEGESNRDEIFAALDLIELLAKNRRWVKAEKPKDESPDDDADDDDDADEDDDE